MNENYLTTGRKLEVLLNLSKALGQEIHLDGMLATMVSEVTRAMEAERTSLFLYDKANRQLVSKVAEGLKGRDIRIGLGVGIAGATALSKTIINIPDAHNDPRFDWSADKTSGFVTRSILSAPILSGRHELVG